MKRIGQMVEEAIDLTGKGLSREAFVPTCAALVETVKKINENNDSPSIDLKRFLAENWQLISFMGMRRALPLPMNVPFGLKRIVPAFNVHHGAEEIILLVVEETLRIGTMPPEFAFNRAGIFEIKNERLLLPVALVSGLVGSVIFHPVNKHETIGDRYWINISDFKMFVSELWGRADLAERIMRFYLE